MSSRLNGKKDMDPIRIAYVRTVKISEIVTDGEYLLKKKCVSFKRM
jgi:hypothetical protein